MMPPPRCPPRGTAPPAGVMTLGAGAWHFASTPGKYLGFRLGERRVIGRLSVVFVGGVRISGGGGGGLFFGHIFSRHSITHDWGQQKIAAHSPKGRKSGNTGRHMNEPFKAPSGP